MYEYHGWVTLRSTYEAVDHEPKLRLDEIKALVDELAGYALMDLRVMNADHFIHVGGSPNRRTPHTQGVLDLFARVGELAPGSYGLLYVWDDGDPLRNNEFRVFRLVRGEVTEHKDELLSPAIPTIEDPWVG